MATYKQSGVDIDLGDKCSAIAYGFAKGTFASRKGMIAEPVIDEGGFTGMMDMGDFYLVQNDDGVGTKMAVAEKIQKFDTLGYDLVAMVADDAACVGAECISVSNTIDVNKLDEKIVTELMRGLQKAASEHNIIVPGGEIAELGDALNGWVWNATAVGVVEKHKVIRGTNIKPGDKIIGLDSGGFRSNGLSLVRFVLKEKFGENWAFEKYDDTKTWGEAVLSPSIIYSSAILDLHGRFKQKGIAEVKGVVNVTGGGIPGNIVRVLKNSNSGAKLHSLPEIPEMMKKLIEYGKVPMEDAYRTWNMGVGMILVCNDVDKVEEVCKKRGIKMYVIGEVTEDPKIDMK
ncbi:MAG: phosphoribosylformylglycinamidine cyclo-ligase [Candidatus Gracilibacteria bacterium]|jgi:phosphoribosylformylglycinamidine cyclo-ligase